MAEAIEDLGDGTGYDAAGRGYAVRNGRAAGVMFSVDKRLLRERPSFFREEGERILNKAIEDAWRSPQGKAALRGVGLELAERR